MPEVALKRGWARVAFGDVVKLSGERSRNLDAEAFERFVGLEHIDPGDLRIRRWGDIGAGTTFTSVFRPGQVLFGKRRAYQRKVAVAYFRGVCSGDIYVLEPKNQHLLPELLPFICQTDGFFGHAVGTSAGSLSPRTNWESLASYEFFLPPLEEQRRIAAACLSASHLAEKTRDLKAACDRARKALIVTLYQCGPRNEELKRTPIGPVPKSWEVTALGERYEVQLGKMISERARGGPNQVHYLRNANVQWNRLELDDVATMSFTAEERQKFALRYGDVLACEGRHVGKSAIWRDEIPGACFQKALHRLRRLSDRDLPEYLLHCLQYFSWVGRFVTEIGETTIPHLSAERFRAMLFPFPPEDQQQEIVDTVRSYDQADAHLSGRIAATRALLSELQRGMDQQ